MQYLHGLLMYQVILSQLYYCTYSCIDHNPPRPFENLLFLSWVSIIAISSKYILAIGKKHIFNPVAISVFIVSLAAHQYAAGGLLIYT